MEESDPQTDDTNGDDPVIPPQHVLPPFEHQGYVSPAGQNENMPEDRLPSRGVHWWDRIVSREKIGWDRAVELLLAAAIVFFALLQYLSSLSSAKQVQTIIDAANEIKSAAWTFSGAAQGINNAGWSAVGKLQEQADQISRSAGAAESTAVTARTTLWASQGAYVIADKPSFETGLHQARIPINNVGHMASGKAQITVYEETSRVVENGKAAIPVESHKQNVAIGSIPMGLNTNYGWAKVSTPKATPFGIVDGTQIIMIVGSITYEMGKGSTAKRNLDFCYVTRSLKGANAYESIVCDPDWMIEGLKRTYSEYREK